MKDIIRSMGNILHSAQNNQKFCSPQSESKIFAQFKYLTSTTLFRSKDQVKNKYTIPHKNLKITITYKKIDYGRVKKNLIKV